jgi:hypothetical protein
MGAAWAALDRGRKAASVAAPGQLVVRAVQAGAALQRPATEMPENIHARCHEAGVRCGRGDAVAAVQRALFRGYTERAV